MLPAVSLSVLGGCGWHGYEPAPLLPEQFDELGRERVAVLESLPSAERERLSFARSAALLSSRSPRWREAVAAYRVAAARAGVPTPLPNPAISVGPEFGFGPDVDRRRVAPFVGLEWSVPLSGRLGDEDAFEAALAEAARLQGLRTLHALFVELRESYTRLVVARERALVAATLVQAAEESLEASKRLVRAGAATALEVSLFRLEHARARAHELSAKERAEDALRDLAGLLAVRASALPPVDGSLLPESPDAPPALEGLRDRTLLAHPALLALRGEYEVRERRLRLEVTRQYPDLALGGSFAGETGEDKTVLGLNLGIELPIFDRNDRAIAEARAERQAARVRYENEAHRILGAVEHAHARLLIAAQRYDILAGEVRDAAVRNVEIARTSVEAGSAGAMQFLDAERSLREVEVELLDARLDVLESWCGLERASGRSQLRFAGEVGFEVWAREAAQSVGMNPEEGR